MNNRPEHFVDDSDWGDALKAAIRDDMRPCPPGSDVLLSPFTVADVVEVYGFAEGETDRDNWLFAGSLKDGRSVFVSAGCDYTHDGGVVQVARNRDELMQFGITADEKARMGLEAAKE